MRVSVRITDSTYGIPAADVEVSLLQQTANGYRQLEQGRTASDGGLLLCAETPLDPGVYQLVADLDAYYASLGMTPSYPRAIVEFRANESDVQLRLQLMVTANSYFTCRESR